MSVFEMDFCLKVNEFVVNVEVFKLCLLVLSECKVFYEMVLIGEIW